MREPDAEREWNLWTTPEIAAPPAPMLRGSDWARVPTEGHRVRSVPRATTWYIECELYGRRVLEGSVDVDPERRGGVPLLKGTGFTVAQALAELAEGSGVSELATFWRKMHVFG
jgi:hypothetical protein